MYVFGKKRCELAPIVEKHASLQARCCLKQTSKQALRT